MWFWWFMLVMDLSIPIFMVSFGILSQKYPPQNINGIIGYRTKRSMKNKETWDFAQKYFGKLWQKIGWVMLIVSFIIHLPFYNSSEDIIGIIGSILCTVQCIILIISIFLTEKELKKHFDDDGKRKIDIVKI